MGGVRYLLWDFGDTLADQRWMWPSPPGVPGWTERYRGLAGSGLDGRWVRGEVSTEELAAALAADLGASTDALVAHMRTRCADVPFFDHAWRAARERRLPQAIVTVNPDLFSRWVVPNYALDETFDVIVTSWEERTDDKARLCELALERIGGGDPAEALLIDDVDDHVQAWRRRGGAGCLRRDDAQLARDLAALLAPEHA